MMRLLQDISITRKIATLGVVTTFLMTLAIGLGLQQIYVAGKAAATLSQDNVSLLERVTELTFHKEARSVSLTRAVHNGERAAEDGPARARFEADKQAFFKHGQSIEQELDVGKALLARVHESHKSAVTADIIQDIDYQFRHIGRMNADYQFRARRAFNLFSQGKVEQAKSTIQGLQEGNDEAHGINEGVRALSLTMSSFINDSMRQARQRARTTIIGLSWAAFLIVVIVLGLGIWVARSITGPVNAAVEVVNQIARGDRDLNFPSVGADEIGTLLTAMKRMCGAVAESEERLKAANQHVRDSEEELRRKAYDLGQRMKEQQCLYGFADLMAKRDEPLRERFLKTCELLRSAWQFPSEACVRLTLGRDEVATKNFQATAWRLASPIVVDDKHVGTLEVCYLREMPEADNGPFVEEDARLLAAITSGLGEAIENQRGEEKRDILEVQLRATQKLEAVGQLAAGIAHEINTPTQFVADSVYFLKEAFEDQQALFVKYREAVDALGREAGHEELVAEIREAEETADLEYLEEHVPGSFSRCVDGLSRIASIVGAMKEFAHPDQREKSPADLNQAIQSTLVIAKNEYKYVADAEVELGDLPPVWCYVGDLNQVFLNLIVNSAHAIGNVVGDSGSKGVIRVRTAQDGDAVRIELEDTGCGIPAAIRDRIFDPFFTTKEVGKGSGQGLALARSVVVDKHNGTLTCESEEGKGSTFIICLPIDGKGAATAAAAA